MSRVEVNTKQPWRTAVIVNGKDGKKVSRIIREAGRMSRELSGEIRGSSGYAAGTVNQRRKNSMRPRR